MRSGQGALRALQRHPLPRSRRGGQLGSLLLPGRHPRWIRPAATCCSSNSSPRSAASLPISTSISSTSGGRKSSNTCTASTGAIVPRCRRGFHLPAARRPARGRQGVGRRSGNRRPGGEFARFGSRADPQAIAESGVDTESELTQRWAAMALQMLGFPRHLSQHSGGFVLARGQLSRLVPIEKAAMPDRRVIQWDKDDLDAVGLLKVDVLALACCRPFDARWISLPPSVVRCSSSGTFLPRIPPPTRCCAGRFDGRLSGRVAGADVDVAEAATPHLLRLGDRGGHRPPRPRARLDGASLPAPAPGKGAGHLPQSGDGEGEFMPACSLLLLGLAAPVD